MSTVKLFDEVESSDLFSYAALTREDEAAAREDAAIIKAHTRSAAESIIEVGLALKRQKERLPHGMFLPWIKAEFGMNERSAQRFIRVADTFGGKYDSLSHLGKEALYLLAEPSTTEEVLGNVVSRAASGEKVSAAEVKRLKAEAKAAQERIDTLEDRNAELTRKAANGGPKKVVDEGAIRAEAAAEVEARLQSHINELAEGVEVFHQWWDTDHAAFTKPLDRALHAVVATAQQLGNLPAGHGERLSVLRD